MQQNLHGGAELFVSLFVALSLSLLSFFLLFPPPPLPSLLSLHTTGWNGGGARFVMAARAHTNEERVGGLTRFFMAAQNS